MRLGAIQMRIVAALIDMYGPSDLDILCAWFRGSYYPYPL
jgi:hypothetical protein